MLKFNFSFSVPGPRNSTKLPIIELSIRAWVTLVFVWIILLVMTEETITQLSPIDTNGPILESFNLTFSPMKQGSIISLLLLLVFLSDAMPWGCWRVEWSRDVAD